MKTLFMNPQDHEIILAIGDWSGMSANSLVDFKFGDCCGQICLDEIEAIKIGVWFVNLSTEIKNKKKAKKK